MAERKRLTGDRCQCGECGKFFNSTSAFDKHRHGKYESGRRCLRSPEMFEKGMLLNEAGFWIGKASNFKHERAGHAV